MMSSSKFSDEFKRDAVAQITEWGYPVRQLRFSRSPACHKRQQKPTGGV